MRAHHVPHTTYFSAGQTALATIFLIGGIIVLLATSLALIALSFANSALGFQAANRALSAAMSGAADAELQLSRYQVSDLAGSYCVPAANLPCPSGYATVTIAPDPTQNGRVNVTSDATVARRRRKIQMTFSVASSTKVDRVFYQVLTQ